MKDEEEKIRRSQMLFQVIRHFKNASNFARVLCVRHSAVSQWLKTGQVPALRCYQIEVFTRGKFKANQLLAEDNKKKIKNCLPIQKKIVACNRKIGESKDGTISKS